MKKFLILAGIAAIFVPSPANAATYYIGTPDCYVQVDVTEPNLIICGGEPPCFTMNPEGQMGGPYPHCPLV